MWSYEWLKEHYHEFKDAPEEDALTPEKVEYYITKNSQNRLDRNSIVKTDYIYKLNNNDILKKVGTINEEVIKDFEKKYNEYLK